MILMIAPHASLSMAIRPKSTYVNNLKSIDQRVSIAPYAHTPEKNSLTEITPAF
jgi:hypothetical protein